MKITHCLPANINSVRVAVHGSLSGKVIAKANKRDDSRGIRWNAFTESWPDRSMPTGLRRITSGGRFSAPAFPLPPHTNHSSPTNPLDDHSHANLGLALHLILWHHTRAAQECSVNLLSGNSRPTSMEIRSNVVVGSR